VSVGVNQSKMASQRAAVALLVLAFACVGALSIQLSQQVAPTASAPADEPPAIIRLPGVNFDTDVPTVPAGLSPIAECEYRVDVLRQRLLLVQGQINARQHRITAEEKVIEGAFEDMQHEYNLYVRLAREHQLADPSRRDAGPLLAIGRKVAHSQDRHFQLTNLWLENHPILAGELVVLERGKQQLEKAIGMQQARMATLVLQQNSDAPTTKA